MRVVAVLGGLALAGLALCPWWIEPASSCALSGRVELFGLGRRAGRGEVEVRLDTGRGVLDLGRGAIDRDGGFSIPVPDRQLETVLSGDAALQTVTRVPGFAAAVARFTGPDLSSADRVLRLYTGPPVLVPRLRVVDAETFEDVEVAQIGLVKTAGEAIVSDDLWAARVWSAGRDLCVDLGDGASAYALPEADDDDSVVVRADGDSPRSIALASLPAEGVTPLPLRRAGEIVVRCRDGGGRPLAGASVLLERRVACFRAREIAGILVRAPFLEVERRRADESGAVTFRAEAEDVPYVVSMVPSEGAETTPADAWCSDRIEVTSPATVTIEAYRGATVDVSVPDAPSDVVPVVHARDGVARTASRSGEEGAFRVGGLPAGSYRVSIGCGGAPARTVLAAHGSHTAVELEETIGPEYPVRVERGTHTHVSAAEARRMVCRFVVRIEAGGDPRPDLDLRVAILDVARSTWRSLVASDGGYETHAVPAGESVVCVKDGTSGAPLFARAVWLGDVEQVETLSLEARGVLAIERAKDDGEPMRLRLRHAESQVTWWATLSRRDGRATFPVGPGRYLVERRDAAGEWQVVDAAVVTSSSERTVRVPRPGAD